MTERTSPRRFVFILVLGILLLSVGSSEVFDQSTEGPLPTEESESIEVNLVILDTVALDRHGRPVPDLTIEDFEVIVDGKFVPTDTFDVSCGHSTTEGDDAALVADANPGFVPPMIVLAFDYLHLSPIQRVDAIMRMKTMLRREGIDGYRLMAVALTGAVRVEQPFTDDRDAALASLDRMENDPTLAVPDFFHQNSFVFLRGLTALFDLLGSEPGNKAVVLLSAMKDVPLDYQFERIAAIAASSRCAIYPVDVRGLTNVEPVRRTGEDVHREMRDQLGVVVATGSQSIENTLAQTSVGSAGVGAGHG